MYRVGNFEKVSFSIFENAFKDNVKNAEKYNIKDIYENIALPERATAGSAGYDFKAPMDFHLNPGESVTIPTGIRVKIDEGWWLAILPRSGHGFKFRIQLDNTLGVIDSDFYSSPGEGHIMVKMTNDGRGGRDLAVTRGTGFVQAIFLPYGITHNDNASGERMGGFGSTGG